MKAATCFSDGLGLRLEYGVEHSCNGWFRFCSQCISFFSARFPLSCFARSFSLKIGYIPQPIWRMLVLWHYRWSPLAIPITWSTIGTRFLPTSVFWLTTQKLLLSSG